MRFRFTDYKAGLMGEWTFDWLISRPGFAELKSRLKDEMHLH